MSGVIYIIESNIGVFDVVSFPVFVSGCLRCLGSVFLQFKVDEVVLLFHVNVFLLVGFNG